MELPMKAFNNILKLLKWLWQEKYSRLLHMGHLIPLLYHKIPPRSVDLNSNLIPLVPDVWLDVDGMTMNFKVYLYSHAFTENLVIHYVNLKTHSSRPTCLCYFFYSKLSHWFMHLIHFPHSLYMCYFPTKLSEEFLLICFIVHIHFKLDTFSMQT